MLSAFKGNMLQHLQAELRFGYQILLRQSINRLSTYGELIQ